MALDDIARYNQARWDELAQANVAYSRPLLDLTPASAAAYLDPKGVMGDVTGRDVLCLASGGGQQSVAFALLGAHVTVFDLSATQLNRDRAAAEHYGVDIQIVQGDMRDLSAFRKASFDLVYHTFSITFVPDVEPVFAGVARLLRPGSIYHVEWMNPFTATLDDSTWNGTGYVLSLPYLDGRDVSLLYPTWTVSDDAGAVREIDSPHEYVHTFSKMVNTLARHHFYIYYAEEETGPEPDAAPGTWHHFMACTAPYLTLWTRYRPDLSR
jgi:SAM-dependent methyltransferase